MTRQIDLGRAVLIAGSAVLFVSLFLDWFGRDGSGVSGWTTFEALDLVLAALAIAAIVLALGLGRRVAGRLEALGVPVAALLIVALQLIDHPPVAQGADLEFGAWMALGATLAMAIGALLWQTDISVTVAVGDRDARPRVTPVDRRRDADEPVAAAGPTVTDERAAAQRPWTGPEHDEQGGRTHAMPALSDQRDPHTEDQA